MLKNKKILVAGLLVVIMSLTSGCSNKVQEQGSEDVAGGEMPKEISIFAPFNANIAKFADDYNGVYGFQLLEETTGCKIKWMLPSTGDAAMTERFNLMIASGDLPDAIVYDWSLVGGAERYVETGTIIPLGGLINQYMPNLVNYNNEHPDVRKQYVADNGDIYTIPFIRGDQELKVFLGPQIRMDWLENLGLDVPKTADDLYNVLKAFKTQDPNGNGQQDEIPMSASQFAHTAMGLGNLLWLFETTYDFYVDNHVVKFGIMEPEFEAGMRYIRKLYEEGLIDNDYILQERAKMDAKIMDDKVGYVFSFQPTKIMTTMAEKNPDFNMQGIPHLSATGNTPVCFEPNYSLDVYMGCALAVTTANKNPVGTIKWMNYIFSDEGSMILNFGKEGVTYNMVDDYPVLTDVLLNNPDGLELQDAFNRYIVAFPSYFPMIQDWRYYEQYLSDYGRTAIGTWSQNVRSDKILPNINMATEQDRIRANELMSQIETYVAEMYDRMVVGKTSVDELPEIRQKIRDLGIDEVLAIKQAGYDNYQNR